jgi:protein-S-isoprenylcysteine O-methyltransferase Ste14
MIRALSIFLVVAQVVLATLLVVTTHSTRIRLPGGIIAVLGATVAGWALVVMGWRRLCILPQVRSGTSLVTTPPYCWIRHPMYTGLLVFCGGLAGVGDEAWRIVCWICLAIVLDVKARLEESFMTERFPEYRSYRQHTWRFVPWIY